MLRAPPGAQHTVVGFGAACDNSAGMIAKSGLTFASGLQRIEIPINNRELSEQPTQWVHGFPCALISSSKMR